MVQELPKERLATTDEKGKRVFLYPAPVRGHFRNLRNYVHAVLVLFFLILPWIHFHGRQLLFLDVGHREFYFFGLHFRATDAPLLVFIFLSFAFLIGLITTIWGRLWCGWACPQTVFIESIFRKIELWIEGNHRERKTLDEGPWNGQKVFKKASKYFLFLLASLVITHSFLAYFVGSTELIAMVTSNPVQNWLSFLVILFSTGIILLDFGWFREQFCVIMCPYGRFQSVMMDSHSLVVGYDFKRGEPRREVLANNQVNPNQGDCVSCFRCVQVCPTGIDIRRGTQMECIACTACIDACDEVMTKIKKPTGLIRYTTLRELRGQVAKRIRPRSIVYFVLLAASIGGLSFAVSKKDFLDVVVLRAKDIPYQIVAKENGTIVVNHFQLDLSNQTDSPTVLNFTLPQESKDLGIELVMPTNPVSLKTDANQRADFFVRFPPSILIKGSKKIMLHMTAADGLERTYEVNLVGPNS